MNGRCRNARSLVEAPGPGRGTAYLKGMGCSKAFVITLALLVFGVTGTASARPKKGHVGAPAERGLVPNIMVDVDESGTPIIMKGLPARSKSAVSHEVPQSKRAERPHRGPRGSSAYVAPIPLPRSGRDAAIVASPPVRPYTPPPLNTFSDRVTNCLQSFPFNAGLGNNPTERDFYVRSCANR
jgi:hypothetical protein